MYSRARRGFLFATASVLTTLVLNGCPSAPIGPKPLIFGFVPSAEADKIAENAQPMADFLARELGVPVKTFTSTGYSAMVEAMKGGQVDIGSLPPLA